LNPEAIVNFTITEHALQEMRRRGISPDLVKSVLRSPQQRESVRTGRDVLQARVREQGKEYLIRVFIDIDRTPAEVVTAYKTSKIPKYWRHG
jgi:hypothetical protein